MYLSGSRGLQKRVPITNVPVHTKEEERSIGMVVSTAVTLCSVISSVPMSSASFFRNAHDHREMDFCIKQNTTMVLVSYYLLSALLHFFLY